MKSISMAVLALGLCSGTAWADQGLLLVDALAKTPANTPGGLLRPVHGQTMVEVGQRFGEPGERMTPVGSPPISRWIYGPFTVYFEHDRVISTVVHR